MEPTTDHDSPVECEDDPLLQPSKDVQFSSSSINSTTINTTYHSSATSSSSFSTTTLTKRCCRVKSLDSIRQEQREATSNTTNDAADATTTTTTTTGTNYLKRELDMTHLVAYGLGSTLGAVLFVVAGQAAAGSGSRSGAGPAVSLSFLLSAVACLFSALCYAEFASRIPVAGSAYSFAYASLGEGVAWFIPQFFASRAFSWQFVSYHCSVKVVV